MTRNEQQMAVGTVVCLAPGWDVVRIPAADYRMGRAAIAAMDAIVKVMGDENASNQRKAAQIDRIATRYVTARWHIQRETGKLIETSKKWRCGARRIPPLAS